MKRALIASSVYFLLLFALGFGLGTIRVMLVTPHFGVLAATLVEVPLMLAAAYFFCRWAIRRWQVPLDTPVRWAMVLWFIIILFIFEKLLGALLFGRTVADQWTTLKTAAGLIGLTAQFIAALFPVFVGRSAQPS